jgi:hypothetical protein
VVAGKNHLPFIFNSLWVSHEGFFLLRKWLALLGPLALAGNHHPYPFLYIFNYRFWVKSTLFRIKGSDGPLTIFSGCSPGKI